MVDSNPRDLPLSLLVARLLLSGSLPSNPTALDPLEIHSLTVGTLLPLAPKNFYLSSKYPRETLLPRSLPAASVTAHSDLTNPRPVGHFRGQFHNANNKYFTEPNKIRDDDEQLLPLT